MVANRAPDPLACIALMLAPPTIDDERMPNPSVLMKSMLPPAVLPKEVLMMPNPRLTSTVPMSCPTIWLDMMPPLPSRLIMPISFV